MEEVVFTEQELLFLGQAMLSVKSELPKIDYHKLAELRGYAHHRSATNSWNVLKKKVLAAQANLDAITLPATTQKKGTLTISETGVIKKDIPVEVEDAVEDAADDNGEEMETPEPAPKKRGRSKKVVDEDGAKQKRRYMKKQRYRVPTGAEDAAATGLESMLRDARREDRAKAKAQAKAQRNIIKLRFTKEKTPEGGNDV